LSDCTGDAIRGLFQFLGRNSGRSDGVERGWGNSPCDSFNSSVGILVVRTTLHHRRGTHDVGFNSSVGILVVRTAVGFYYGDSQASCFNSSVGILVVRTRGLGWWGVGLAKVSIPRSEFWSFGHGAPWLNARSRCCFNSSVGILVVRTP